MMPSEPNPASTQEALCPACGSKAACVFLIGHWRVFSCKTCGHRFCADAISEAHTASVYSDNYFFGGGDGYENYLKEASLLRAQGRRYGRLLSKYSSPGRLLDVGSAAGFIQAGLTDVGWDTVGLEPNATMAAYARKELGLAVERGTLEDAADWDAFDAVCLIQVIGHFNDLKRALASLARITAPGGLCLVEYWRRDSWIARLLGKRWHEYSPPSVLHWFTKDSLDYLMRLHGFTRLADGSPRKYISGNHAKSLLAHKLIQWPLGHRLVAPTQIVPDDLQIRYPAFDLEWRLYRRDGVPTDQSASRPADTSKNRVGHARPEG